MISQKLLVDMTPDPNNNLASVDPRVTALGAPESTRHLTETPHHSVETSSVSQPIDQVFTPAIQKLSAEVMDMIISWSLPGPTLVPSRSSRRTAGLKALSLVSRSLSLVAARHLWHTVVVRTDAEVNFIQELIAASGGKEGRIGSSIRMIYTWFRWTRNPDAILNLASKCSNLLRLDAPIRNFGLTTEPTHAISSSGFKSLKVLVLFGDRRKNVQAFKARDLVELASLEHFIIDTRLDLGSNCPAPEFSLRGLSWQGKSQPRGIRWALTKASALRILMLRCPTEDFVQECLDQYGHHLLALRLLLQGTIPANHHAKLVQLIGNRCPALRELIWDICPDPRELDDLPCSIKHIALKPDRWTKLFCGDTFVNWVEERREVRVVTLWGSHARNLLHRTQHPFKTNHRGFNIQVKVVSEWKKSKILKFAPNGLDHTDWPFEDDQLKDYVSAVFVDRKFR